jgi:hypothetical protein
MKVEVQKDCEQSEKALVPQVAIWCILHFATSHSLYRKQLINPYIQLSPTGWCVDILLRWLAE